MTSQRLKQPLMQREWWGLMRVCVVLFLQLPLKQAGPITSQQLKQMHLRLNLVFSNPMELQHYLPQ
jgi:hypothetical protein